MGRVQGFLNTLSELAATTVEDYRKLLAHFLDNACEDDWIVRNPARSKRLMNPGYKSDGIQAYERDEAIMLCEKIPNLENPIARIGLGLMFFAGLRREEMLALRWEDVDFENNIIHVRRAAVMPIDAPIIKGTKTGVNRPVALCDILKNILLPFSKSTGYIVHDDKGRQFTKSCYKKFAKSLKEEVGISDLDARKLRHTYATYNHASGVEDKMLASLMGHADCKTTMNVYTQVDMERYNEVRNNMAEFLLGKSS